MSRIRSTLVVLALAGAAGAPHAVAAQKPPAAATMDGVVAIVGDTPILRTDLEERIVALTATGQPLPTDSAGERALMVNLLNQLIDEELLLQKAKELKVEVSDNDVAPQVDKQLAQIRKKFKTEAEFRTELRKAGFGTPDEYRKFLTDQARRQLLQQKLFERIRQEKKLPMVPVTDAEVDSVFNATKGQIPRLPSTVTLRQVVVAPKPSPHEDSVAFFKADTIYEEIVKGADFEQLAKRESQDPGTKELGGDFGWRRRGDFVPEFELVYFSLLPGHVSPPFRTPFGWHIVRVDRVQPGEVKGRHILIRPKIDSIDIAKARAEAEAVAKEWRAGAKFDTLVVHHHDAAEEKAILNPFPQAQLPAEYQAAFAGHKPGEILDPFSMEDKERGLPKFFVVEILTMDSDRDASLADYKDRIRDNLAQEKAVRRYLDILRRQTFVVVRL
jgi:peptidyl-prolyl cis-trans isomerase SurA